MENVSAMAVDTVTMETPAQPKHKWLAKGSRLAKKAVLAATTRCHGCNLCNTGIRRFR